MKYKWKDDKSKYLWQYKTHLLFERGGWKTDKLEEFNAISEQLINNELLELSWHEYYYVDNVNGLTFHNMPLFLQHEVEEYLEKIND